MRASPAAAARTAASSWSGGASLSMKPLAPACERFVHVLVGVEGSQDQYSSWTGGDDAPGGLDAVHRRHANVHEHDIGLQLPVLAECFQAVAGLTDHHQVGFAIEDDPKTRSDQALIVDYEYLDRTGLGRLKAHVRTWVDSTRPGAGGRRPHARVTTAAGPPKD